MTNRRSIKRLLRIMALVAGSVPVAAHATVETGWDPATPNTCRNATDGHMTFELGVDAAEISSTIPGLVFSTTLGLQWAYGDITTGGYNVGAYGDGSYSTNGDFFAWLGVAGDRGRVTFAGGNASYFSALVSSAGLSIDAFDSAGNLLATSGRAPDDRGTGTMTRLTVEATGIAYVEIHDTGNFWIMDEICSDAPSPCKLLSGRSSGPPNERLDVVFMRNSDYTGSMDDFETVVNDAIDTRVLAKAPISGRDDEFNFYITDALGSAVDRSTGTGSGCGRAILPADFLAQCPMADSVGVLHAATWGDCSSSGIFAAETDLVRSFIHEGGHGMFRVFDEYDDSGNGCATSYGSSDANIFLSQAACQSVATANGANPNDCWQFTTCASGRWRPDTGNWIMNDGSFFNNGWGNGSTWWINGVFSELVAPPAMPAPYPESEMSLVLDLTVDGAGITVHKTGFVAAPARNQISRGAEFKVEMRAADGTFLGNGYFQDPRFFYGDHDYAGPTSVASADATVVLPYHHTIQSATITSPTTPPITIDLSQWATGKTGAIADAGGPYSVLEGDLILLDASASTGNIVSYEWDLDADGQVDVLSATPDAVYVAPDDFFGLAYVRVLDSDGFSSVAAAELEIVNVPPSVEAGDDITGVAGKPVTMAAAFSDPGILDTHVIEWFWGDGSSSVGGVDAAHVYDSQGTYDVLVRVTDDDGGFAEDALIVTILHDACVLGETVLVGDRAQVLANLGAQALQGGNDALLVGDAVVDGDAILHRSAFVDGNLTLAGHLLEGSAAQVSGALLENAEALLPSLALLTVTPGTAASTLQGVKTLPLGNYGKVTLRTRSRITLQSGTYNLAELKIEPDVVLVVPPGVRLNVAGAIILGDGTVVQAASPGALFIYTRGTEVRVGSNSSFKGTIVAPDGTVSIRNRAIYSGCVGAKLVEIQPDALLSGDDGVLPFAL